MNSFANIPEFPSADFKAVARPNFDTLYSIAWLDFTKEPMIVSVPDTGGGYYLMASARLAGRSPTKIPRRIQAPEGDPAHLGADAYCVDHRTHQNRWPARLWRRPQDPGGL